MSDIQISRVPTDLPVREVEVADVIFSTTDRKGVITDSNAIFERLAAFSHERIMGSPHNIIRHPDMPGGAFALMWELLEDGKPFVGYVRNKAADEHSYDVLATVTPLPDGSGYLSVRTRPMTELFAAVGKAYCAANELEKQLLDAGKNRREAAQAGKETIKDEVAKLGYVTYEELSWELLPTEVAAREKEAPLPQSPMLESLERFHAYQEEIGATVASIRGTSDELGATATEGIEQYIANCPLEGVERSMALSPLQSWIQLQPLVESRVRELRATLGELDTLTSRTRFAIALARLQAAAAVDNTQLEEVMRAGILYMQDMEAEHQRLTRRVGQRVRSVASIMSVPALHLRDWLESHDDAGVRRVSESTQHAVDSLTQLAEELQGLKTPELVIEREELPTETLALLEKITAEYSATADTDEAAQ